MQPHPVKPVPGAQGAELIARVARGIRQIEKHEPGHATSLAEQDAAREAVIVDKRGQVQDMLSY